MKLKFLTKNILERLTKGKESSRLTIALGVAVVSLVTLNTLGVITSEKVLVLTTSVFAIFYYLLKRTALPKLRSVKISLSWPTMLSVFLALFVINFLYANTSHLLHSFGERAIGIVVLEGIDTFPRTILYSSALFIFPIAFFVFNYVYSNTENLAALYMDEVKLKNEKRVLLPLSLTLIFLIVYQHVIGAPIIISLYKVIIYLVFLSYLVIPIKFIFYKSAQSTIKALSSYGLFIVSLIFPIIVFFIRWLLVNGSFIFSDQYFLLHFPLWIFFWVAVGVIIKIFKNPGPQIVIRAITKSFIPFSVIPVVIALSSEIQFILSKSISVETQTVAIIFTSLLTLLGLYLFIVEIKNKDGKNKVPGITANYIIPIILISLIVFYFREDVIFKSTGLDTFHHGENLMPVQQLFGFSKIPFLDIFPTHGLSNISGQILYSLFNGYRVYEPWLWEWLPKIVELLLLYFLIKKVSNSFFAGTVILFLPILSLFGGEQFTYGHSGELSFTYYFIPIVSAISISKLLSNPTVKYQHFHWIISIGLITWRVDFGLVALFVSILLVSLSNVRNVALKKKMVIRLKPFLTTFALITTLFFLVAFAKSINPLDIVKQVETFILIQGDSQALPQIALSKGHLAVFQYFILPSVSVFYLCYYLYHYFRSRKTNVLKGFQFALLFLAIFSFLIASRGMQRQTLSTIGFNEYLFVFLIAMLPFYLRARQSVSMTFFVSTLFIYLFIFPHPKFLIKDKRVANLRNWQKAESRVDINRSSFENVAHFLSSSLKGGQTFLDLSNSPILYVETDKEFPLYFIPGAYQTSDVIQEDSIDRLSQYLDKNAIPYIIFRQPSTFANNIDKVPNEVRSYKIYEFVYQNYEPFDYIDDYFIWAEKDLAMGDISANLFEQNFDLANLPYVWANYDKKGKSLNTAILSSLVSGQLELTSGISSVIETQGEVDKSSGNYLHFRIKSPEGGALNIQLDGNKNSSISLGLVKSSSFEDYLVRISTLWQWYNTDPLSIELTSSNNTVIESLLLRKGD